MLEALAPPRTAAAWDNCGLQLGNRNEATRGIAIALNPSLAVARRAAESGANLLVTHHPLFFKATKRLDTEHEPGRTVEVLMRHGITLYTAHTNLDFASSNRILAKRLELPLDRVLGAEHHMPWFKLAVFTPEAAIRPVLEAMWAAGAGRIGNYDQASFRTPGTGSFRPLSGAHPAIGIAPAPGEEVGTLEEVGEQRIEVLVREPDLSRVVAAMRRAHPYEEVAFDVVRLENGGEPVGYGIWGELAEPIRVGDLARRLRERVMPASLRLVGDPEALVRRVGMCTGSGGDLVPEALKAGCDLFITGEVRYHTALDALAEGLNILEAGHQCTEEPLVGFLAGYLGDRAPGLPVHPFSEPEPFRVISR